MVSQEQLIDEASAYKKESKDHFWEAVASLLALAWPYRKEGFSFDDDPDLRDEALSICINLSDKCDEDALRRLRAVIAEIEDADAWIDENDAENLESFDMAGTHLLDLLAVWIGVAVANGWTRGYTRVMMSRYLHNPFLCPEWKEIPLETLAWGRGYAKDIAEQLALIGQGIIIGGARYIEWADEAAKGAVYYVRRRGSSYDCDQCESIANIPIPISVPFDYLHPRCCCYPEYFYEQIPI